MTRLRPVAVRATTLPQSVAAAETGALQPKPAVEAETAEPLDSVVVVSRDARGVERGTCALCWSGPEPMAGTVRRISATNSETRVICSRCLVTLEMLAVQFDPQLELHVETPA